MVHVFHGFFGEFLHLNTMKACKAGNHECFLGNEGKDVEQQKFFTTNNKQYTVHRTFKLPSGKLTVFIHFHSIVYQSLSIIYELVDLQYEPTSMLP